MLSARRKRSQRSRSPIDGSRSTDDYRKHHRQWSHSSRKHGKTVKPLPFNAPQLSKIEMEQYLPLLTSYLDIQKQISIEDLDDKEVKGRWKSFMGKWNRGELAEGWYDPSTKLRIDEAARAQAEEVGQPASSLHEQRSARKRVNQDYDDDEEGEEEFGPVPAPPGPSTLNFEELAMRDEAATDDVQQQRKALQIARRADRSEQREILDELAPRAEAGTRERALEKKKEAGAAAKAYRENGPKAGEIDEVDQGQLFGGEADIKAIRQKEERKKNEREIRREEILRARALEREERMQGLREKESKTLESLKDIARERFG
ncbi:MAG: hypothetical protein M1831_002665 [Alyxoria varia]|nr:MAG: hypothetical protein M1831_002665 [Alyxoria varia]